MKTKFFLIFGLVSAALFVIAEAGLYFYGANQTETKVTNTLATIATYSSELEQSYANRDTIKFKVLAEETQRKIFGIAGVLNFRIEHVSQGLLYSATTEQSTHQVRENSRTEKTLRFVVQYELLDLVFTTL